jgi:hypothetical protein
MSSPAQQMSGITRTDLQRHDLSVPDRPSKPLGCGGSGRFRKTNSDGTSEGYRYSATVNYDDGSYTWHLGGA